MPKARLKSVFLFQTLLCPLFWGEVFEPLIPGEQFIAVFQSGERRRALPLIQRQGVERLVELPPGVGPARRRKVRSTPFPPAAKTALAPYYNIIWLEPSAASRGFRPSRAKDTMRGTTG